MMNKILLFFVCFLLFFVCSSQANDIKATCTMHDEQNHAIERYRFSPNEKIFVVIDLAAIPSGDYEITIDWQNPLGQIERQNSYSLLLEDPKENFRLYSWLKLWKNGYLTRSFTGQEFKEKFFGEWHLAVYVNGQLVARQKFCVT